jgi:hypothetical protein
MLPGDWRFGHQASLGERPRRPADYWPEAAGSSRNGMTVAASAGALKMV